MGTRRGVRRRGCDVLTAQEDGRGGVDDPPLLDRAEELGRVMFSRDDEPQGIKLFKQLAREALRSLVERPRGCRLDRDPW